MTLLITHDDADAHATPPGHPEQVARRRAVLDALSDLDLDRRDARDCPDAAILRCHPQSHLDALAAAEPAEPAGGAAQLDPDTWMAPGSLRAARLAAGGAVQAVDAVLAGEDRTAFVAMRPPGHHAERARAMGFCLLGTVAIAARHALDHHGLERVAVVDFDVHHGNGTQDLLWDEGRAMFVSTHQSPLWPGTGAAEETGAHGQVVNLPLPPGSDGDAFRDALESVLPRLRDFAPDLVLVSAGFDAHADDPLAGLDWGEEDFVWATRELVALARESARGRVVSVLEGGYDLRALGASARAHVTALMEGS